MTSQKSNVTVHLKKLFHARGKDPSVMLKLKLENDEKYQVFDFVKSLLKSYSPPLLVKGDNDFMLEAWSTRELLVKRKIVKVLFASVALHEKFVSLYFMPLMTNPLLRGHLRSKNIPQTKGHHVLSTQGI